jgi:hypothetical protein
MKYQNSNKKEEYQLYISCSPNEQLEFFSFVGILRRTNIIFTKFLEEFS